MLLLYQTRLEGKEGMGNYFLKFSLSFHAVIKQNPSTDFFISQLWIFQRYFFFPFPWKANWIPRTSVKCSCWIAHFYTQECVCHECKLKILLSLSEGFSFSHIWLVSKHSKSHFNNLSDNILFEMCISVWINIGWLWALYWFLNWVYTADIKKPKVYPHNICSQNTVT